MTKIWFPHSRRSHSNGRKVSWHQMRVFIKKRNTSAMRAQGGGPAGIRAGWGRGRRAAFWGDDAHLVFTGTWMPFRKWSSSSKQRVQQVEDKKAEKPRWFSEPANDSMRGKPMCMSCGAFYFSITLVIPPPLTFHFLFFSLWIPTGLSFFSYDFLPYFLSIIFLKYLSIFFNSNSSINF